jgi:hypothetical protein
VVLGYIFAVLAALASGSGSVLESIGIRRAGVYGGRSADLISVRREWIYFVGVGVDMLGFFLAAAALHRLPLFLVQSMLAFSIGVTATISAFMGARLAAVGWIALVVGAVGLVMLGVSAEPGPARVLAMEWRWFLLAMVVPVLAIGLLGKRSGGFWAAPALAFAAGLGFSVVGVAARTLTMPDEVWRLILEPSGWAIVLNALAAAVLFAMALQQGGPTAVTAIMFTTNTALSSLAGLLYLDDHVRAGLFGLAAVGFVLAITGAIGVAHFSRKAAAAPIGTAEPAKAA